MLTLCACSGTSTAAPSATPAPSIAVETAAPAESAEPAPEAVPSATLPDSGLVPDTDDEMDPGALLELAKSYVDKPLAELQEEIGEPISSSYVSSCLIPGGQDGELQYEGFIVSTVRNGDSETVLDVREG